MPPSIHNTILINESLLPKEKPRGLLDLVSSDLESLKLSSSASLPYIFTPFPKACQMLLRSLPGNNKCIDCNTSNPQWASISYGCLLCVQCCGRHRSFGVNISRVRSLTMDSWSHNEVLAMLEGGNNQLAKFFDRHELTPKYDSFNALATKRINPFPVSSIDLRYRTKAALFYRKKLSQHVQNLISSGTYKGREISRKISCKQSKSTHKKVRCEPHNMALESRMQ